MKLKKGFVLHDIGEDHLMIATGKAAKDFNGLVRSNSTAQFILKLLQNDTTESLITDALVEEYDIDRETAAKDVHNLIEKLNAEGFLDA